MIRLAPALTAFILASACSGQSETPRDTDATGAIVSQDGFRLVKIADGLAFPWGMAALPNGDLLVTERDGGLRLIRDDALVDAPLTGLPDDVIVKGQGGLLGLTLDPDFADNRKLYMSYAKAIDDSTTATAVISARLSDDDTALENVSEIFVSTPREGTWHHYGSRLTFLPDGSLIVTLGDGYRFMESAQDTNTLHGKIARIMPDGSLPADNPFANGGGHPAVWSYGHRNVQGVAYHAATDTLFAHEHGPKGGDEINIIEPGKNYGWPTITYGINYDGTVITDQTAATGMEQPAVKWVPSIAPSGLTVVQTPAFSDWDGDLLLGAMNGPKGQKLVHVDVNADGTLGEVTDLMADLDIPFRDVISTPEAIYLTTVDLEAPVYRLEKAN